MSEIFIYSVFTRLKEKTAEFEKKGMRVSQIRSVGEPLRLGRLQGNHFDLVVRGLRPHPAGDTHSSGTNTHTRLAALVKEAVENVEVLLKFQFLYFSAQCLLTTVSHACRYSTRYFAKLEKYCLNLDTGIFFYYFF